MAELKEYEIEINGLPHTVQLDADEAKRLGGRAVEVKAKGAANKSRSPKNKEA